MATFKTATIDEVLTGEYDDLLDVRTPAEFADDHLPGAINLPVLSNEERVRVGTLYTQSPFEAQRLGAALIARNIAQHLETALADKPRTWKPLVYCWRGGMRSGALAHILSEIGWRTTRMHGGYKAYRGYVLQALDTLPPQFLWCVISGPTGSGKSRLLQALAAEGAQVLDLEQLALHRGSLLGNLPDQPQPAQKLFESRIWEALRRFDPQRPVFVEAESRRIGLLRVPGLLLDQMRAAPCIAIEAPLSARVAFLLEDYEHFLGDPASLAEQLAKLTELQGRQTITEWNTLAANGEWPALVEQLLVRHYDPAYKRSSDGNFSGLQKAQRLSLAGLDNTNIRQAAQQCLALVQDSMKETQTHD
ncbi:tRNA 2-selenouridine synthase [Novimethylophilus kurashikiensis]|uniref:tRNA 2-selenouridine synthase n=1 Tax=Novimethylophilus kurashikiensis TaxID=1825523 RepID=A0A2R5FCX1_9PROT|nr:tRNA 2-selenouridine(34) synthase MnmH [Novimethylophilus kurashikiensis]GBG15855.1 tRNA 2-selenouridine synthase [Novimethylophilus kurashikiensis]